IPSKTPSPSSHKHLPTLNYYLVSELSSTLIGYHVHVSPDSSAPGLTLQPFTDHLSTLDEEYRKRPLAAFNRPPEITSAPDNQLLVSNRSFTAFQLENPYAAMHNNSTCIPSDSMATFSLHLVEVVGLNPAGGVYPRSFAFNKNQTLVAVGLQHSGSVVVYRWCGHMQRLQRTALARFDWLGNVTSIVWAE
ncbi:MAG: hypothetical protein LQ351_000681, partial [Letrouitia transgressa]